MAAAAYRAGVKLEDLRTAQFFDFTRRSGVVAAFIVAPDDAGVFACDRVSLWNAAEAAEKRKDARTAREWVVALPEELNVEQRSALALDFARELVTRYGVVADVAIHAPSRGGDDRNHHAHILCTTRKVNGEALGEKCELELSDAKRKTQDLGPAADEIFVLRERWAKLANAALEKSGSATRVDHRSLAAQQDAAFERGDLAEAFALDRPAQIHVGVRGTQLDRRAKQTVSERGKLRECAVAAARHARRAAARWAHEFIVLMRPAAEKLVMAEEQMVDPLQADAATRPENPLATMMQRWRKPASDAPMESRVSGLPRGRPRGDETHPPRPTRGFDPERGHDP